jgi:hypothetical protein
MSQLSTALSHQEKHTTEPSALASVSPLAVPPEQACHMLQVGMTHLYGLMRADELDNFYSGRARRIPVDSIKRYIARRLAAAKNASTSRQIAPTPPPRPRGRPSKAREGA